MQEKNILYFQKTGLYKRKRPMYTENRGEKMVFFESESLLYAPYTHADDGELLRTWADVGTKRGYNYAGGMTAEMLAAVDIGRYPFWSVVVQRESGQRVGVLRLSGGESPDLAIWVYPEFRGCGIGREAFSAATEYLLEHGYERIYAGCYENNRASLAMLKRAGYRRMRELDEAETDAFTGGRIVQLGFVCGK